MSDKPLALKDYIDCLPIRTDFLIKKNAQKLQGMRVLEIGAHVGVMSEAILNYSSSLTVIENNPDCVHILKKKFGKKLKIIQEDAHHALLKMKPHRFDVIICAGILYHSSSPLFLLESICRLTPKLILIDTLTTRENEDISLVPTTAVNRLNFRYNNGPDSGFNVLLGQKSIEEALFNMHYKKIKTAQKIKLKISQAQDSSYFQHWKNSYTQWFQLKK